MANLIENVCTLIWFQCVLCIVYSLPRIGQSRHLLINIASSAVYGLALLFRKFYQRIHRDVSIDQIDYL